MSTTLSTLITNIAKETGYATGTCSGAGTTTTIVDSSTDSPLDTGDSSKLYDNTWAKIESDSAETPLNVGEVRRASSYATDTATVTVSRAFSNATTATQTYGLYLGIPPTTVGVRKGITQYINDTLRAVQHRELVLLSLGTDMDMETSGTTNWTGANSTLTKQTAAGTYYLGKYGMSVVGTAANGYAKQTFRVAEGEVYNVAAMVEMGTGAKEGNLQLYDETNAAEIESASTEEASWRILYFQATIPADCVSASVRLISVTSGASGTSYWDNVSFMRSNANRIDLPTWLSGPNAVENVYRWRSGSTTSNTDSDSRAIDDEALIPVDWFRVVHDQTGTTPYRLEFSPAPQLGELLVASIFRPYAELSSDTDTTDCPADLVKAGALYRIHSKKGAIPDTEKAVLWGKQYIYESRKLRGEPYHRPMTVGM